MAQIRVQGSAEKESSRAQPRRLRTSFSIRSSGWLKALLLRSMCVSWRKDIKGLEALDARLARNQGCIITFWHGKYLPLSALLRGRRACIFSSYSHRGSLVADICQRFGYVPVQIPDASSHKKLEVMREALTHFRAGGMAVDGPVGPYHFVKSGAVRLASQLGYAVVPVSVASTRTYVLSKRWDKMEVPKPFSRVRMVVGDPIIIPRNLGETAVHDWSEMLHDALERIDNAAVEHLYS